MLLSLVIVRSPFRSKHYVVVQYMARWLKCPLPLPPDPPLPPQPPTHEAPYPQTSLPPDPSHGKQGGQGGIGDITGKGLRTAVALSTASRLYCVFPTKVTRKRLSRSANTCYGLCLRSVRICSSVAGARKPRTHDRACVGRPLICARHERSGGPTSAEAGKRGGVAVVVVGRAQGSCVVRRGSVDRCLPSPGESFIYCRAGADGERTEGAGWARMEEGAGRGGRRGGAWAGTEGDPGGDWGGRVDGRGGGGTRTATGDGGEPGRRDPGGDEGWVRAEGGAGKMGGDRAGGTGADGEGTGGTEGGGWVGGRRGRSQHCLLFLKDSGLWGLLFWDFVFRLSRKGKIKPQIQQPSNPFPMANPQMQYSKWN